MAELVAAMEAASLDGTSKVQESRGQSMAETASPPTSPESPGFNDGHKEKARKQQRFRHRRVFLEQERRRPSELMKRAIQLETMRRMGLQYSDPVISEDKKIAWPMIEYSKRRLDQEAKPMLFFDISRKPSDPAYKPFYLAFEGGEELPADVLEEYLQLPLSPNFPLQMIRIRCEHEVLINWDVIVERKDDQLRVIDVFEAIYNTYNTPLTSQEKTDYKHLVDTDICDRAYIRRSKYIRADFGRTILRGICRVDLLGNTTLFNGLFFDDTFKQYCLTLREQEPNDIRLSPLF
ncbi:hypothetical protein H0H93_005324 [Arthromyces matolae]|nr:hypothetical protein H0H93_005324 [Arthromyces matolae]